MTNFTTEEILVVLSGLVSIGCIVHMWRQPGRLFKELLWGIIILVPFFGPLFYGAFYILPPPKRPEEHSNGGDSGVGA